MVIDRHIDDLGRIIIPKEMRRELNIKEGDNLSIELKEDGVFIYKKRTQCNCCGNIFDADQVREVNNVRLCKGCAEIFAQKFVMPFTE